MTEPSAHTVAKIPIPDSADGEPGGGYVALSWLCIILAVVLVAWGLLKMLTEGERLVGGDAFNYIIAATRGAGLVTAGGAFAALAATFAIFALRARR